MRLSQEIIDEIRNKADIVQVISNYIPLVKKGRSYKAVCPFHDDHDPSMSISQEKQIYRCFVCGAGGNCFTFVQKIENISFVEAVVKVAEISNVPITFDVTQIEKKQVAPEISRLYKLCNEVSNYCNFELDSLVAKPIKQYLIDRGLTAEILKEFQIGYHPKDNKVHTFLQAKHYSDQDMVDSNVVWITSQGMRDVFSNRIMIPIHDEHGNTLGFSARRVDDTQEAKYVNTSETRIYHKGEIVFNLHRAKQSAKQLKKIYVVEGAMDVLAFKKAGISNCVATLGTACTKEQLKKLKFLNVDIMLCYDGDKAGVNATYKFVKLAQTMDMNVVIVNNKYGLDPDEIIEQHGKDEFIAMTQHSIGWIEFLFDYLKSKYDLNNYSEKLEYAKEMAQEIELIKVELEKNTFYQRLQQISGFDARISDNQPSRQQVKPIYTLKRPNSKRMNAQNMVVRQILKNKQACDYYRDELGFLLDEVYNNLGLYIVDYYRTNSIMNISKLYDQIKEEEIKQLLLYIENAEDIELDQEHVKEVLKESIIKIQECMQEEKINELKRQSEQTNDPVQKARIAQSIVELRRMREGGLNGKS